MTGVETYSILLNTTISVLIVGYGVWLRNVFKHQIEAKDASIGSFEAALKSKDAEIARLSRDTAPAITANYDTMRKHADQMAADVSLLTKKLDEHTNMLPLVRADVEARLLLRVVQRILNLIGPILVSDHEAFQRVIYQLIRELNAEAREKIDELPDRDQG